MAKSPAPAPTPADAPRKTNKLRWVLGWIVTPLLFISALFLAGVHVGARHPQMWLSRAVLWVGSAEPQAAPPADAQSMATRMRLAVLPSMEYTLRVTLDGGTMVELGKELGIAPELLDCAAVCEAIWRQEQPKREFFQATRCVVTETKDGKAGKLECDAKVQPPTQSSSQ